jgi:hypothetical protein
MNRALEVAPNGEARDYDITEMSLEKLQGSVGGLIEAVSINDVITMWVNEEFLFRDDLDPNPMATALFESVGGTYAIHGTVVFTGGPDFDGNTLGLRQTDFDKLQRVSESMKTSLVQFGFIN